MDQITEMVEQSKENIVIRYLPSEDYEQRKEKLILALELNLSKLEEKKQEFIDIAEELLESKDKTEKTIECIKKDLVKIHTTIIQTKGYASLARNNPFFRD
jgi:hypothetical protein